MYYVFTLPQCLFMYLPMPSAFGSSLHRTLARPEKLDCVLGVVEGLQVDPGTTILALPRYHSWGIWTSIVVAEPALLQEFRYYGLLR